MLVCEIRDCINFDLTEGVMGTGIIICGLNGTGKSTL